MKVKFTKNNKIEIYASEKPYVCARAILPTYTDEEEKAILKRPFLNKRNVDFFIHYKGEIYMIHIPKGYAWDGATIPFGFRWILGGKGNPQFLVASMVHDKMCECKWLVNNDRYLSSLIFKELLLACGCEPIKASVMFHAVDNFQKLFGGWNKKKV